MDIRLFGGLCGKGNILEPINYLERYKDESEEASQMFTLYTERFITQTEKVHINSDDPWVISVLQQYHTYLRKVLTGHSISDAEKDLVTNLSPYVHLSEDTTIDIIEDSLTEMFNQKATLF